MIQVQPIHSLLAAALLSLPLSARAAAAQDEFDRLVLGNGSTEEGKVLEETWAGVSFQPEKGAKKVVAWDTIQSVEYSDAPEELQAGIDTLAAGNPQDALPLLETALTAEGNRPLIVQQALFHLAYAQQRQGMAEASASYAKLLA